MEIEIQSLEELDPSKIYHIELPADAGASQVSSFATAVKDMGLRALITRGGVRFEAFLEMFENLPAESKAKLLEILQPPRPRFEIDPRDHEQTK